MEIHYGFAVYEKLSLIYRYCRKNQKAKGNKTTRGLEVKCSTEVKWTQLNGLMSSLQVKY